MKKNAIVLNFYKEADTRPEREVKSVAIMSSSTDDFHPEGLFSTGIFGAPHTRERNKRTGYINLQREFITPEIFKELISSMALHKSIIRGTSYAVFDDKIKNFVLSNENEGETGFSFYIKHIKDMKIPHTESEGRENLIKIFEKAKKENTLLVNKQSVLPAGLRDYSIDESGQPSEDEVNDIYRKIISNSVMLNSIGDGIAGKNIDKLLASQQFNILELYNHFDGLISGKHKAIQGYLAKRATDYGTRNVITASKEEIHNFNDIKTTMNDSYVGVYQTLKGLEPLYLHMFEKHFLSTNFDKSIAGRMMYINPKTFNVEAMENIRQKDFDLFTSDEGIVKLLDKVYENKLFNKPVEVQKKPLALIYDDGSEIQIFRPNDDLTQLSGKKKELVRTITYIELFYFLVMEMGDIYGLFTRHPIATEGNIFPAKINIKPTFKTRRVVLLNNGRVYEDFPVRDSSVFNSMAPHFSTIPTTGADFDGDKETLQILQTEESKESVKKLLNSVSYYVDMFGSAIRSNGDEVVRTIERTINYYDREIK